MNTVVGGFSVIKALKFLREEICLQIFWGTHIFSWGFWDHLKEGEASFLFEWAGSFPCKVLGKTSVQVLCCSRSLSCVARAVHSISACAGNLVRMCWIGSVVHSCYCACAAGACSISLTGGDPSRRMSESTLLLPGMSFSWQLCSSRQGSEGGPWHRGVLSSPSHTLSHSWGIPVSEQKMSDAASCFRCWVCWSTAKALFPS